GRCPWSTSKTSTTRACAGRAGGARTPTWNAAGSPRASTPSRHGSTASWPAARGGERDERRPEAEVGVRARADVAGLDLLRQEPLQAAAAGPPGDGAGAGRPDRPGDRPPG